jgi:hypothetical protein
VVGLFPGMGCVVPQVFASGGDRSYLEFWDVIGGPRYPGYITPIVSESNVNRFIISTAKKDSIARYICFADSR